VTFAGTAPSAYPPRTPGLSVARSGPRRGPRFGSLRRSNPAWSAEVPRKCRYRLVVAIDSCPIRRGLRSLDLDTALSGSAEVLQSAIALVGHARLLYGTDCGAATDDVIVANTKGLANAGLSQAELADIECANAAALFT
jgi:hypothetical protein